MKKEKLFCVVADVDEDVDVNLSIVPATSEQILSNALGLEPDHMAKLLEMIVQHSSYSERVRAALKKAGLIFISEAIDRDKLIVQDIFLQEGPYSYHRVALDKLYPDQLEKIASGAGLFCKLSPEILPDSMREQYEAAVRKVRAKKKKSQERSKAIREKKRKRKVEEAKKLLQQEGLM